MKKIQASRESRQRARTLEVAPPFPAAGLDERRGAILLGLDRCIRQKGYAHSSLADIATAAGMSPSHVLYYFSGREAVLELYLQVSGETILADLRQHLGESPEAQIDAVARYFFGGRFAGPVEQGLILELFGQAVHRPRLKDIKAQLDRGIKSYLIGLFRQTPLRAGLSAEDAGETAYALLAGFITTAYFDERLGVERTRQLVCEALRQLAGLDRPTAGQVKQQRARRASSFTRGAKA